MASFLPFVKMDANAHAPSRASTDAAGLDLFAVQEVTISPGNRAQVETGIQVAIPPGYYGRIAPRSGLALRHGIDVGGGVVDADYRDGVAVVLFNHGAEEVKIRPGDRIAQLIVEKICCPEPVEVASLEDTFLPFVKMDANAHAPSRASTDAAGLDLFAVQEVTISPGNRAQVETGIQVAIPPGYYGRIAPRSGLALRHGIDVGGGVVDADYRDGVAVVLFNHGAEEVKIRPGDRIAQLIVEKICFPEPVEVAFLEDTARGAGGFSSTGN